MCVELIMMKREMNLSKELTIEEKEEIYNIISDESFPSEYIHFDEDFIDIGKGVSWAYGRASVDGKMYEFSWNYREGIEKYSIERVYE